MRYLDLSRELGALRPLGRSLKEDDPLWSEPAFEEEALDFELFDEGDEPAPEAPLLLDSISEEPDFEVFEEAAPADEPAGSTPSDFAVSESRRPVALRLFAL